MNVRIGQGFDVHAFGDDSLPLWMGGVKIPHEKGLIAHSDGDVLLHAICDACLGALALGDIGHHFPDSDPRYRGIDSRTLLRHVIALLKERGARLINVDSTIVAQRPKMAPHIPLMRQYIAEDMGLPLDSVSVKATTTEKLGFTGREEGIACYAVVLLERIA
ncbi:MAG: 2-C-methyl-D-erythritol 2,4-cyclodiphosphate synthase [Hahellaceae bacterium]|nr:2-C-methyl-D-erythritol 2,4-cyclodiphosphate synthase [Hahellaceae bacterium]